MRVVEVVRGRTEQIAVPCHHNKQTVPIAIPPGESFATQQHDCPACGRTWAFAVETGTEELEADADGAQRTRRVRSVWMREGRLVGTETVHDCERALSEWFPAEHTAINHKSLELRERRAREFKHRNLAKHQGTHLLTCADCGRVSDLDAIRWRVHHDGQAVVALCPRCGETAESRPSRG
jgi:predicted RNA-binding Zn-ribbon protein involved in translation (DUF1610 family)